MNEILLGDYDWFEEITRDIKKPLAWVVIENEAALALAYEKALSVGPGLLRTPTLTFNSLSLSKIKLNYRLEAAISIAISTGKHLKAKYQADCLLAGVLGPLPKDVGGMREYEMQKIFGESAVYIIDQGVDTLLLEGFDLIGEWEVALKTVVRINSVPIPIAAFFRMAKPFDPTLLKRLLRLSESLEIELLGFEIEIKDLWEFEGFIKETRFPYGIKLVDSSNSEIDQKALSGCLRIIERLQPSLLTGGKGIKREKWLEIKKTLAGNN
ncbi:MAG: homocysteine S-methyltransferase family protein [Deltaproteobacteria bacterium]|nr:homocysteine S-methyltransferase family protein [Deltaproteobacteria bacterium]